MPQYSVSISLSSGVSSRLVPPLRVDFFGTFLYLCVQENGSADVNVQLWKLAQSRLAMSSKSGSDMVDRGAIQIGDLPATTFLHDDMEDQVRYPGSLMRTSDPLFQETFCSC